jgi:crotonobetainyl-CoA:carnitine CoA-transferase CaiB-like acyl-CoA transferase
MIVESFHTVLGKIRQLGAPIKFAGTPCDAQSPAPVYGMHTVEILEGLGYTQERIEKLRGGGIIE